ncbi:MAG: twin-arginine translocase subunit TatB [Xanthomonadales bacterium]|nr:twin-arginine translocase subunit TatB [Xanthomonadales bacterium]
MFDLGFSELFLIGVVSLIVLGPERLPKAARTVGVLLRRARNTYVNLRSDIERELAADELKRSLKSVSEPANEVRQAFDEARQGGRDFQASLRQSDAEHQRQEQDSALQAPPDEAVESVDLSEPTSTTGSTESRRTGDLATAKARNVDPGAEPDA